MASRFGERWGRRWGDRWGSVSTVAQLPDLDETRLQPTSRDTFLKSSVWQRWHMEGHTVERIVEGWTNELPAWITTDREGALINLSGMTVDLILTTKEKVSAAGAGTLRVDDTPSTARVYFTPTAELVNAEQPYRVRLKITDGDGKIVYVPNAGPGLIEVFEP